MTCDDCVRKVVKVTGEPAALYRFYDARGTLLYVGISRNLAARWAQHEADKYWWPAVKRKTVVMYGSRIEAELAEGRAIRSESPVHNKAMGRRDKSDPKRSAQKPAAVLKKTAGPRPRESYTFDAEFMAQIDAYTRRHDCSRTEAVGILVAVGLQKFEEEERESLRMEEELGELRKTIAAEVAGNPEAEAEFAALLARQAARRLEASSSGRC